MTNEIYTEDKMNQKPVYPTKTTPSYADWKLFEMGKALEEKVDESSGSGYTAGSGIAISDEKVISNTAQPDVTKAYVDNVDVSLQQQIDAIVASSDVRDIVGTYAQLQAYDTSTLGDNDIIKVLVDSTHNDATGYYRWVITNEVGAWTYIGSEGPYYTKAQVDTELLDKMDNDFSNADVGQATAGQVLKVNSSANGVEFASETTELPAIARGDAGKVLVVNSGETGVEWQSVVAGGGYEYVTTAAFPAETISPYNSRGMSVTNLDINYDYIIVTMNSSHTSYVSSRRVNNSSSITIYIQNIDSSNMYSSLVKYSIYRRPKVGTTNEIQVIGTTPSTTTGLSFSSLKAIPPVMGNGNKILKVNSSANGMDWADETTELPSTTGNAGKVLAVNSGATGVEWVTPSGKTAVTAITDLSVGDIFIGRLEVDDGTSHEYGISGYVASFTSNEIIFNGVITGGSTTMTITLSLITSISGYKI